MSLIVIMNTLQKKQNLDQFCGFVGRSGAKTLSALTPHQGLCPWTPLGALPPAPDPRYRLVLHTLAMGCPPN